MFDCRRCNNSGRITERYVDMTLGLPILDVVRPDMQAPILTRVVECPACLGFSVIPLRPRPWV
jgi:hypothetical protein